MKWHELLTILLLLIISIPSFKSLLIPGGFTSHDLTHHIVRQISMDRLLSEGQFPPRWSGELNNGYGYPVFLFNYPLPALIGETFHKAGLNFVDSVKAVLFISLVGSVVGMYLFLKQLLKSQMAAFLGACFYLYAPIRFLNVYVSAAVGSALGLMFVPFVFWAIASGRVIVGALALAGLILSHNVTSLMFFPVMIIFSFARPGLGRLVLMSVVGLGLSAWFWLPALVEKQYLRYDLVLERFYADHFPTFWQLIHSPWGYGLSHKGVAEDALSFQIGLIHIGVMIILMGVIGVMRRMREVRVVGGMSLLFFAMSVFLMLEVSLPLWDNLPLLRYVQFPARFLAVAVFSASITAGLLIKHLPYNKLLFIFLLALVLYANRNHLNINQRYDPGEEYYLNLKTTSSAWGEHLPKWGKIMQEISPGKFEFIKGDGNISYLQDKSALVLARIETTRFSKLRFNQLYFPGWTIIVDDANWPFNYLSDTINYGVPTFDIKEGSHLVKAEFKNTTVRYIADAISLITFVSLIILVCLTNRNKLPKFK